MKKKFVHQDISNSKIKMKKIHYFPLISLLFLISFSNAQTVKIKKGEKSYEIYSYKECIQKFEGVTNKPIDLKRKLAESYFKTGDYTNAEKYYGEVAQSAGRNSEDIYNYASILKMNQKYNEADKWMDKFCKIEKGDSRTVLYMQNKNLVNELLNDSKQFIIKNIDINTSAQDFGTAFYGKTQVVFASTRSQLKFIKRIWNWNEKPFLDLYIADFNDSQLINIKKFKKKFNKKYHEGPASFNKSADFIAYTSNNYKSRSKDGIVKLQILTSKKKDNQWRCPVLLKFNSNEYSVGHPALTEDGKTMYFASDMLGGYGKTDIYVTTKNENGEWSNPVNLGKSINTEGNEMFPFIHKNNYLFFASDGLPGIGGLDIFMSEKKAEKWSHSRNLGNPINSNYDDFAFILDEDMKSGFFSSNRKGGKGNDDIYYFKMLKPFKINIKGIVKDEAGNILAGADVLLYDDGGKLIKKIKSNEEGKFLFLVEPEKKYKIIGHKAKYNNGESNISTIGAVNDISSEILLTKNPNYYLVCLIKDKNKNPIEGVSAIFSDKIANTTEKLISSANGKVILQLKDKKPSEKADFNILLDKKGYLAKKVEFNKSLNSVDSLKLTVYMDKITVGMDLKKIIKINPIYFDLNKYNIRPDAAKELDKIVKVMNENPNMVIELGSHTDSRGSDAYNLRLSDKRAKASAKYIKERITNPKRIYGKGYGETKLLNRCKNGVRCSEKEHQVNRRTEFKIIKM